MSKAENLVRFLNNKLRIEKIQSFDDQFGIFKRLYHRYDIVFIFESLIGPKELSEFSIIGFDPELTITCDTKKFIISDRSGVTKVTKVVDPLRPAPRGCSQGVRQSVQISRWCSGVR